MELKDILVKLQARLVQKDNNGDIYFQEGDRRILTALEYAIVAQSKADYKMNELMNAIVNQFIANNSKEE